MTTRPNADWIDQCPKAFHEWLGDRHVDEVECIVSDIAGISRGKAMPQKKFSRSERLFLPTSIFYQTITGSYAEIDSIVHQWTESDLVLKPDLSTATAVPWSADVTTQVIHDVLDVNDEPIGIAPRNVLKRIVDLYAAEGWVPVVAPELDLTSTRLSRSNRQ